MGNGLSRGAGSGSRVLPAWDSRQWSNRWRSSLRSVFEKALRGIGRSVSVRLEALSDSRRGHGLRYRQWFVLACATVSTLMGAGGYRAFESTAQKFTQRQLRGLGCRPDPEEVPFYARSDGAFQRLELPPQQPPRLDSFKPNCPRGHSGDLRLRPNQNPSKTTPSRLCHAPSAEVGLLSRSPRLFAPNPSSRSISLGQSIEWGASPSCR